jgi:hypothetical protein
LWELSRSTELIQDLTLLLVSLWISDSSSLKIEAGIRLAHRYLPAIRLYGFATSGWGVQMFPSFWVQRIKIRMLPRKQNKTNKKTINQPKRDKP